MCRFLDAYRDGFDNRVLEDEDPADFGPVEEGIAALVGADRIQGRVVEGSGGRRVLDEEKEESAVGVSGWCLACVGLNQSYQSPNASYMSPIGSIY